jgi:methionyl-tRNA formyltransferase
MKDGADLVLKTVRAIESGTYTPEDQSAYVKPSEKLKPAPKIFKEDCKINWKRSAEEVHNFIRGLSPYPTAWTEIKKENEILSLKIFKSAKEIVNHDFQAGSIFEDMSPSGGGRAAKIAVKDGFIHLLDLQLAGRKKMNIEEFLRGFSFEGWQINL